MNRTMTEDPEPILCPYCGGTGLHPWKNAACRTCHGTGELADDVYDERYKKQVFRAHRGCFDATC